MDSNKGKPVTTSVPSIAIRFHANAEEIEELYASDEEQTSANDVGNILTNAGTGEPESSPLKGYLPKLIKRSASIDTSGQDSSPPSDPWKFLSDIKGKITKSVEDKLTEIKAKKEEEGSPRKLQTLRDDKENLSVSDSEDLSESSISKTCGVVSTTEGVEMSSDEDTPSLEKDVSKKEKGKNKNTHFSAGLRRRFKLFRNKSPLGEGLVSTAGLQNVCSITTGIERPLPSELNEDIESGVDVLEEGNFQSERSDMDKDSFKDVLDEDVLKEVTQHIDNIEVDEELVLNVEELNGSEVKEKFLKEKKPLTVFAPVGFVDMRNCVEQKPSDYKFAVAGVIFLLCYYFIQLYSLYLAGFVAGVVATLAIVLAYNKLFTVPEVLHPENLQQQQQQILEIPAIKEYQPLTKLEGWMNEYPEIYDPLTYHISQTQPVFLRLQGHLLRISHTKSKVPKRIMWNEPKIKPNLTYHRIYNLLGAQVTLLPVGLTRKRFWSKKYPICITLSKDQLNFDYCPTDTKCEEKDAKGSKKGYSLEKKKCNISLVSQRFSKLTEEDYDVESESRESSPSPSSSPEVKEEGATSNNDLEAVLKDELTKDDELLDEDLYSLPEEWICNSNEEKTGRTKLYLFARCDREKEDWFRRFVKATHKASTLNQQISKDDSDLEIQDLVSETPLVDATLELEYTKFMSKYTHHKWKKEDNNLENGNNGSSVGNVDSLNQDMLWVNAVIGRILFDCVRNEIFTLRLKERIQRKLKAIKLPYFIEELNITELSLGNTSPLLHHAYSPVVDQRGLWIDIDMTYEGLVVLILQTNLNLMKLKQQRTEERQPEDRPLAMFHSDIDDSAESSSNDESTSFLPNMPSFDSTAGGASNTSKKVLKMVDKIAESKFFQAATENRYIKNLMEEVSNTDLRLKVEVRSLSGKLVLNIPPPPSDRIFVGFRPVPKLLLSAQPIVGERNITMIRIIHWIEKKLLLEFQKIMVVPNMEDFVIPVMCQKLPG